MQQHDLNAPIHNDANPVGHMNISTLEHLRSLYAPPGERARRKQLSALDAHCRRFIELSPFLVLATSSAEGHLDASPRGGLPGFAKVSSCGQLLIPDAPGNNRLDSMQNIIERGQVGILFFVPGVDETLRVNGTAVLSTAPEDISACHGERRVPKVVIKVRVREAYLHCAKALMRSELWQPSAHVDRSALPTMGQMINDQTGIASPLETQEAMRRRYAPDL